MHYEDISAVKRDQFSLDLVCGTAGSNDDQFGKFVFVNRMRGVSLGVLPHDPQRHEVITEILFFSYGIKITSKRVVLISQRMIKSFRYEDVIYIKIDFHNESIQGEIKAKQQKACTFCFDGIDLSGRSLFLSHLWISGLKLSKRFVDQSIASLSNCEKVRVQNFFTHK